MEKTARILTTILGNRVLLFAIAIVAILYLPLGEIYYENLATYDSGSTFLNGWSLWDGNSYVQIARDGYFGRYLAYFPLWPFVLKVGGLLAFGNYAIAGLVLNTAFSIGAACFLSKLCKAELENDGLWANIYLFFFPTAFFLTALYGEAMFLFLGAGTMWFLKKKKWLAVAIFAFLAAMTKEVGGCLILPIAYVVWKEKKAYAAVLAPIFGVLAVLGVYYVTSGDPLVFLKQHSGFGKELSFPYAPIVYAISNFSPYQAWNLLCLGFTAFLAYKTYKMLPKEYFWYIVAMLLPPLCSSNLEGYSRYLLVAFPLFMMLGARKSKLLKSAYLIVALPLLMLLTARYVTGAEWIIPTLVHP